MTRKSQRKVMMMNMMIFLSTEVKKIVNLSAMDISASILKKEKAWRRRPNP